MSYTGLKVCKKPCRECPFKKKSMPGWLGGGLFGQAKDYIRLATSNLNEPCHMSPGHRTGQESKLRPCAGMAIFRHHIQVVPQNIQAREAIDQVTKPNDDVFSSKEEFIRHHESMTVNTDRDSVKAVYSNPDIFIAKQGEHKGKYMVCSSNDSNIPLGVGKTSRAAWKAAKDFLIGLKLELY